MLGYGAIGQFTIGQIGPAPAEGISEDKWHYPWSEPFIKTKIGLLTGRQQFLSFQPAPSPFVATGWRANLSEPVRLTYKHGLKAPYQQAFTTAVGILPRPSDLLEGWYNWYSEPKRFKNGLSVVYQQSLASPPRLLPKPNIFATMAALEINTDAALFSIYVVPFGEPDTAAVAAAVSVKEIDSGSATSIVEV